MNANFEITYSMCLFFYTVKPMLTDTTIQHEYDDGHDRTTPHKYNFQPKHFTIDYSQYDSRLHPIAIKIQPTQFSKQFAKKL